MSARTTLRIARKQAAISQIAVSGLMLAACALVLASAIGDASAASRRSRHATPATLPHDIENETTATIAPKKTTPGLTGGASTAAAPQDDETIPPPFRLPTAPRKRMRECGLKWQTMKMAGEAGDDIWRTFATHCLAAANGPFDKPDAR